MTPSQTATRVAFVYGVMGAGGGLAVQTANALTGLATGGAEIFALGPSPREPWPVPGSRPSWQQRLAPPQATRLRDRLPPWRWRTGEAQLRHDRALGGWAAEQLEEIRPDAVYAFTQVAREALLWARRHGVPSVLETPNGHLRAFRQVYQEESRRWCGTSALSHPSRSMVERVEEEYDLADRIRVSSRWTRSTLLEAGIEEDKIAVLQQPVDLSRFRLAPLWPPSDGPLRLCFVGSLDLRKGFVYLLRALRRLPAGSVQLEIRGATGDRCSRRLFEKEARGLPVVAEPGDPVTTYHRSEVFVLPTLEDGSPFAVAEAMACGLPVVVAESCGSAEWVRPGVSGWVVPPRDPEALTAAIAEALERRGELAEMGRQARLDTEERGGGHCHADLGEWFYDG